MRLYGLSRPIDIDCADVKLAGENGYLKGNSCGHYVSYPKPNHRTVEWLDGSNTVCPFVWIANAIAEVLVTEELRHTLEAAGVSGVDYLPTEYYQDPKILKPQRRTKKSESRVWLPYEGPPLYVLWANTWVHADLERSSVRLARVCQTCGHQTFDVEGIESRTHQWDRGQRALIEFHKRREPGKGVYVREDRLSRSDIFRLHELPGWILCKESVKQLLEDRRFANATFLELGESFSA